uniref:Uncharacterized protein n=1 Tax=Arundo donax TaxID=35708 RepID=A0A0A9AFB4_ARUDO
MLQSNITHSIECQTCNHGSPSANISLTHPLENNSCLIHPATFHVHVQECSPKVNIFFHQPLLDESMQCSALWQCAQARTSSEKAHHCKIISSEVVPPHLNKQ